MVPWSLLRELESGRKLHLEIQEGCLRSVNCPMRLLDCPPHGASRCKAHFVGLVASLGPLQERMNRLRRKLNYTYSTSRAGDKLVMRNLRMVREKYVVGTSPIPRSTLQGVFN